MSRRCLQILVISVCVALAAAAPAGCGKSGASVPGRQPEPAASTAPPAEKPQRQVRLFFYSGQALVEVSRGGPGGGAEAALVAMLKGPTPEEAQRGLVSAVPRGTRLNSYSASGGTATADFSEEMSDFGGGSAMVEAIIGQVRRTITANDPAVATVRITVMGVPAEEAVQP